MATLANANVGICAERGKLMMFLSNHFAVTGVSGAC
jgi:hypothetical protein